MNSKSEGVLQVHAIMLNSSLKNLACVGMLEKEHCPFQNVCNTTAVGYGAGDQDNVARVATDESSGPSSLGSSGAVGLFVIAWMNLPHPVTVALMKVCLVTKDIIILVVTSILCEEIDPSNNMS